MEYLWISEDLKQVYPRNKKVSGVIVCSEGMRDSQKEMKRVTTKYRVFLLSQWTRNGWLDYIWITDMCCKVTSSSSCCILPSVEIFLGSIESQHLCILSSIGFGCSPMITSYQRIKNDIYHLSNKTLLSWLTFFICFLFYSSPRIFMNVYEVLKINGNTREKKLFHLNPGRYLLSD